MGSSPTLLRRNLPRIAAVLCCVLVWGLAQLPTPSRADRAELAGKFQFTAHAANAADDPQQRRLRPVAAGYHKIRSWVSSVGAGAGLFAVDGGTVSRDLCLVDPRTDTVTVSPAPTTGDRFRPFTLAIAGPDYVAPMGCLPADLNEDGWQDVVVYYWGRSPVLFMRTPDAPPAAESFQARELVSPAQVWNTNAATLGDYDGDGHLDLVFGNYFPDGARVLDPSSRESNIVMSSSLSNAYNGGSNRLYRFTSAERGAEPLARFVEVADAFDAYKSRGWTLALGSQDLDNDGLPELYVANDFGPDELLVNQSTVGKISFREARGTRHGLTPKSKVVGNDSFKGMGVAFAELNTDGIPDILVSNITEPYALQESNFAFVSTGDSSQFKRGEAPYDDHSEQLGLARSGWSWDVKAADFNNDGTQEVMHATGFVAGTTDRWAQLQEAAMSNDLILSSPALWPNVEPGDDLSGHDRNTFFVRGRDGRFVDVAAEVGVGTDKVSRSFAIGDVDGDGRRDFVVANQWTQSTLYQNSAPAGQFLGLRLRLPAGEVSCSVTGQGPTRPAVGASAVLTMPDGTRQAQQVYPANGHNGVDAPDVLFGLGDHRTGSLPVSLSWRDGCGRNHETSVKLDAGWHQLRLEHDGTAKEDR